MTTEYPVKSYISPKIALRTSQIHGLGLFAQEDIAQGEVVFIKGGHIATREELYASGQISSYLPIDDQFFLGARNLEEEEGIKLFANHSCEPNCGIRGEITFVALRKIPRGEELTFDYATVDNEDYEFECHCGSPRCRKKVTGFDWKRKELQARYRDHFARYLLEKIRSQ